MRDPARIEPMLDAIRKLWQMFPDWRLCQLVVNVACIGDPFYMEDDEFLKRLVELTPCIQPPKDGSREQELQKHLYAETPTTGEGEE